MAKKDNNGYIGNPTLGLDTQGIISRNKNFDTRFFTQNDVYSNDTNLMSSPPYIDTTPLFTASLTGGGSGSLATASLSNGSITNMIVYSGGTGYPSIASQYLITMSFSNGGGQDAAAYVSSISAPGVILTVAPFYSIQNVIIADGGGPYSTAPTLTFSTPPDNPTWRPRVTATGTATITEGKVTGVTITTSGSNYVATSFPTITVSGGGLAAGGTHAVLVPVLRNGRGYTSNPTLTITSPTGTGAVISSSLIAGIGSIDVTAGGGGYTTPPTVRIQGADLQDISATAVLSGGTVSTISVTSGSSRFSTAPSINISGGLPPFPTISNNQIMAWCSVYDTNSNFVGLQISTNGGGGYTVDWGDGTSNNYNSAATGSKQYTTASYAALTSSIYSVTDLYKPVLVTVSLSGSATSFSSVNFTPRPTLPTGSLINNSNSSWRSIKMAGTSVTSLTFQAGSGLFSGLLETFEYSGSNSISNFSSMFFGLRNLVEVVSLNTATGGNFNNMFQGCSNLQKLPPLDFNSGARLVSNMFSSCYSLREITLLNSQNVTAWDGTFSSCYTLQKINATFGSGVTNYGSTFNACYSLKTHPPLDVSNNTSFIATWQNCMSLKQVKFIGTTSKVTNWFAAFGNCYQLESLPSTLDLSACTSMYSAFSGCFSLKTSPIFTNTRNLINIASMFASCRSLVSIPWFDTINVTDANTLFNGCSALASIPKLNFARNTNFSNMFSSCASLASVPALETSNGTNFVAMFNGCFIKEPPFFNTSKGTNFTSMFQSCTNLLKVPAYDLGEATNVATMFSSCTSLVTIPMFNLTKCTGFIGLFSGCSSLRSVPYLNTPLATSFNSLFANCFVLSDVGGFNSSKVTDFSSCFNSCFSLKSVPLMDTSRGTNGFSNIFNATSINEIPALNMSSATIIGNIGTGNLKRMRATGMNASFDVSNNNLDSTALNEIYTNASATGNGKTITVTGNWGAANDTPSIATAKGWAVTG